MDFERLLNIAAVAQQVVLKITVHQRHILTREVWIMDLGKQSRWKLK